MNTHRDGQGRHKITKGTVNYWPNRFEQLKPTPASEGGYAEYPQKVEGVKQRIRGAKFKEHYNQAQLFYNSLAPHEKAHLAAAISFELSHVDDPVVYESYTRLLNNVDFDLAKQIAVNVGGVVSESPARPIAGHASAKLLQRAFPGAKPTIKTRRIAILVADGFDLAMVEALRALIKSGLAVPYIIGSRRGKIYAQGEVLGQDAHVWADHHFEGQRSTLFDAFIALSGEHCAAELVRALRASLLAPLAHYPCMLRFTNMGYTALMAVAADPASKVDAHTNGDAAHGAFYGPALLRSPCSRCPKQHGRRCARFCGRTILCCSHRARRCPLHTHTHASPRKAHRTATNLACVGHALGPRRRALGGRAPSLGLPSPAPACALARAGVRPRSQRRSLSCYVPSLPPSCPRSYRLAASSAPACAFACAEARCSQSRRRAPLPAHLSVLDLVRRSTSTAPAPTPNPAPRFPATGACVCLRTWSSRPVRCS
jgi:hypothetical protein